MTTFENFISGIGHKEELEPFKFHLLNEPLSLIDQHDHFHAAWALAWVRKNDSSNDCIVYALVASPIGSEIGMRVLHTEAINMRGFAWGDYDARYLPWVLNWLNNAPPALIMKGGYIAARAKQPQLCEYCHVATKKVARNLFRARGYESQHRSCKSTACKDKARLQVATEINRTIFSVVETEMNPFS
jgi:hypothetical protein